MTFNHCVLDMWIGHLKPKPQRAEFDAVLTIGHDAGSAEDGIRHFHLPDDELDTTSFLIAVSWAYTRVLAGRRILIRSQATSPWPALVVAGVVIECGGHRADAINSVRHARTDALSDEAFSVLLERLTSGQT